MAGLSPYRNRASTNNPGRDFSKQLETGIANGQLVDGDIVGLTTAEVEHSLGRPYRGAIVVGQSASTANIRVITPEDAPAPEASVSVRFTAAYTGTVRLWVF